MVELLEYCLVVMVSTLLVAGSVAVYGDFSSFDSQLALRAEFGAISGGASEAVQNGSARLTTSVPPSSVACEGGVLVVSVAGASLNETLPVGCSFDVVVTGGVHTFTFGVSSETLDLAVT